MNNINVEEKPRKIKNAIKRRMKKISEGDARSAKRWGDIAQYKSERRVRLANAKVKDKEKSEIKDSVPYKEKSQNLRTWNSFEEWDDQDK